MHKNWGYGLGAFALGASVATAIALFIGTQSVTTILAIVTIVACVAALGIFHRIFQKSESIDDDYVLVSSKVATRKTPAHIESVQSSSMQAEQTDAVANTEASESTPDDIADSHKDEESGLLSKDFFPVYLEQRITAARRTLRPVSLVIFELDGLDKNDSGSPTDRNFFIGAVGDVVKRTLRESDCAFRLDHNTFAAVMDDTAESGAVWAAERVRGVLHTGALAGRVTVSAGVACYPSHALDPDELIDSATKALEVARSRGVDQVEIAAEQL
jgi:diguanylate cyclase (GGDEF)-like protein